MVKKIINCIVIVFIVVLITFTVGQSVKLGQCRTELGQVRTELQSARNRTSDIRKTVECFNGRTREIFSESITTVQELRKQIQELRKEYENMEKYINNLDSD